MRQRIGYKFWLGGRSESDRWLMDTIAWLKANRSFASAIRDGLRLIVDLRQGNTDVLLELFPHLRASVAPAPPGGAGGGDLEQIKAMLEIISKGQTSGGYVMQSNPPAAPGNPRPLAAAKLALPVFEDDDLPTVIIKKSEHMDSSKNFISMMQSFNP